MGVHKSDSYPENEGLKAVVLAGGQGLRLQKVVRDVPKPMASVAGKPFLEYLLLHLVRWDFREIVLCIGYKGEIIKTHFGTGERWGVKIEYSEEEEPLGTGGALREAFELIDDDLFLVMNGDSFFEVNPAQIAAYHKDKKATATIGLAHVDDVRRYGKVELNLEGEIVGFSEKTSGGRGVINGGVYVFSDEIINKIPPGNISLERQVFPVLIRNGLYGMVAKGVFIDIGVPQDYLDLRENPQMLLNAIGL